MKLGIIGQGYVGTAVKEIMSKYYEIQTFDIDKKKSSTGSISELVTNNDIIFICVPTPMNKDGSCNTNIVEDVIEKINFVGKDDIIVVIKSTIPPGTTDMLNKKYNYLSIVFNPEFLTEANFIDDFKNQDRIIIGGPRPATTKVRQMYSKSFPNAHIIKTSSTHAEMVKYMTNSFLATKVSFANEMKMLCDNLDIDYDKVIEYATHDERLGKSHWAVPGPDGKLGFGGSCFPKDLNALMYMSEELGIYPHMLHGAWNTNLKVRPEEDWKELKGRAVVDEK
ncbi:nucleotide sugar dehydrogenase [archaeon]|jgi:nucleotide sugar dehydrogenase|nr:nucleotide sugar dehydrogenase [archaeon]